MSFNYEKNKNTHSSDSFWTSYSDLFLGLSTIFLLLYVIASLRTGTDSIRSQVESQKLSMENEELKNQLKMYEQVKSDYMEKANKDEVQEYKELMDKLTLLKEDAKSDQERLALESLENERKAQALNKYQQMVRNIINANKVAKTKIQARNGFIQEQDVTIDEQKSNIKDLESDVAQKKDQIEEGERKIEATKEALAQKQKQLLKAFKANQISKKVFEEKTRQAQEASEQKVNSLVAVKKKIENQLEDVSKQLEGTQMSLAQKEAEAARLAKKASHLEKEKQGLEEVTRGLASEKQSLEQKTKSLASEKEGLEQQTKALASEKAGLEQQTNALKGTLDQVKGEAAGLKGQINSIKAAFAAEQAKGRAALDAEIRKGQMDAAERARREGEFRKAAAAKEKEMEGKIAGLQGTLKDTTGALAKAREEMDARREVAREISKGFQRAGIKADIDMQTGEVVLDFGDHYFDSDSASLNAEMKNIIERAMPVYSKSLFGNEKVANKISAVEIIGFASPTYQGRFIDPRSSKPEDRTALKYNMDLSYRRANSIFSYLLDGKKQDFEHQKNLLALMKVSGRSFLEVMKVPARGPATAAQFCKVNDCKKAQRVIVRFSMDGKK